MILQAEKEMFDSFVEDVFRIRLQLEEKNFNFNFFFKKSFNMELAGTHVRRKCTGIQIFIIMG